MRPARTGALLLVLSLLGAGAVAQAETAQSGNLKVAFQGKLSPSALPRTKLAPVQATVGAKITSTTTAPPPKLSRMAIGINRYGHLDLNGLPKCPLEEIQPATNGAALEACESSLVGHGRFDADVAYENIDEAAYPFPSHGKVYAFNGEFHGRPAILAHVYGTLPGPTSYTIPFVISRSKGTFGVTLTAALPDAISHTGYVTGLSLTLGRTYFAQGRKHFFLSASCPTPSGVSRAPFKLARGTFFFEEASSLSQTLTRSCRVR